MRAAKMNARLMLNNFAAANESDDEGVRRVRIFTFVTSCVLIRGHWMCICIYASQASVCRSRRSQKACV